MISYLRLRFEAILKLTHAHTLIVSMTWQLFWLELCRCTRDKRQPSNEIYSGGHTMGGGRGAISKFWKDHVNIMYVYRYRMAIRSSCFWKIASLIRCKLDIWCIYICYE